MPAGPRTPTRPGAGPGRSKARARTRPASPSRPVSPTAAAEELPNGATPVTRRRSSITTRAIALAVVALILVVSYASSLRIYLAQASEIEATKAEISERQARIADLQTELARWDDPAYVRTQARERLGWVVPGETGYRVIDADGKPLGGGAEITAETKPSAPPSPGWWQRLWGSVAAADNPAPAPPPTKRAKQPTLTEKTKPSR